jgi:hypothetical protein
MSELNLHFKPVLFLDFDGVLHPLNADAFNPSCVEALNSILRVVDCEIVISSTWRRYHSLSELNNFLLVAGVIQPAIATTPHIGDAYPLISRHLEIDSWLRQFSKPSRKFVILDDDDDMGPYQDRWILVNYRTGLTKNDGQKAVALLG